MKKLTILFILIYATSVGQVAGQNQSQISGIQGNNNIIIVMQGNDNKIQYNLLDEKDATRFLEYLRNLPNLNDNIKQALKYDKATLDMVTKIYDKITDEGVFNFDKFIERYNKIIIENNKLKSDNSKKPEISGIRGNNIISVIQGDTNIVVDNNNTKVIQDNKKDSTELTPKSGGFHEWISNTNNLFILLISIATFMGLGWKGIQILNKNHVGQIAKFPLDNSNKSEIDEIHENNISVVQSDSNIVGDNNNTKGIQDNKKDSTTVTPKSGGFHEWISNTNNLFVLLISIATFIGLVWTGIQILKKSPVGQIEEQFSGNSNKSEISGVNGNNNIITVIQGNGNIIKYNLLDEKDAPKFLEYLRNLSNLNDNIKKLLKYDKTTLYIATKIYDKITDEGIFNTNKFVEEYNKTIIENDKLKKELEEFRKQTTDPDFTKALEEANKKLEVYDNEGYQKVLADFKTRKKTKISEELKEVAQASYLQAKNSYNNFNYTVALSQISEALEYDKEIIDYLFLKAQIYFEIASYDESLDLYHKIVTYNINDTIKSRSYNNIGMVYNDKGDYDQALEYYRKALAIDEKVFGKEHPSTASLYSNIGSVYYDKGNYDQALKYYGKALAIEEKVFGKEHPSTATSYNNIGLAYYDKGDYDQALEYYRKALAIREKVLGKEHLRTATSYNNIGLVYSDKGDYDQALEYYRKALTILQKVLGKEHPLTAKSYNNIGMVYNDKGDYDQALEYYRKALAIREKVLGKEHPSTATSYNNIGMVYDNKGDYDQALECYRKALAVFEKVFGKEHPRTATTYGNIGMVYHEKGDYDQALEYYRRALSIEEKILGKEHPRTAISYNNIGGVYDEKGDYDQAFEYYAKALAIQEKVLGKEHPSTITTYVNISVLLIAKGEKERGLDSLAKTSFSELSAYKKSNTLNSKGVFNFEKGRYKEALNFYLLALEFLEDSNTPKTDAKWAAIYQNIAMAYCYSGQKDKALPLFEKALLLCKDVKEGEIDIEWIKKNYEECKSK